MIFLGDVAIAPEDRIFHEGFSDVFSNKPLCINLEGSISFENKNPEYGLVNTYKILDYFEEFNLSVVSIANNHISDQEFGIAKTIDFFKKNNIQIAGGGKSISFFQKPAEIENFQIISFGWEVIGCLKSQIGKAGIYNLDPEGIISNVKKLISDNPNKQTIVNLHWNYEFEKYPQPAHRQLAHKLIDLGVHSIIGHHPHIVSPIEFYKDKCIVYSLGNWAISRKHFFKKRLSYPDYCKHQIAFETTNNKFLIHHSHFENNTIKYVRSEEISSDNFSLKPEFQGLSNEDYLKWFRKKRLKKILLPIYKDINDKKINKVKNYYVKLRQILIDCLLKLRIKNFRN